MLLSDEDMDKLKDELPDLWNDYIERLSEYMASTGRSYKNHLATIRKWAKKDIEKNNAFNRSAKDKPLTGAIGILSQMYEEAAE